jgi:pyrimidine and pyridine-specific 5'-nucleotidase
MEHISLNREDAHELHLTYSKTYGLAIEGLVRHHEISALEFNAKVDDALPLEDILKPDPELRKLIQDIDARKVKLWLFTNAYVTHGKRVVRILGIDDLFEGITFCDYAVSPLQCKPHRAIFDKAMSEAGVQDPKQCFFVGAY